MDGTHADALAQENGRMRSTVTQFDRRRGVGRLPRGFTLIEVMIVVVIIALLATVALPAYLDQVRKSRRADAIARISQVQQAQERWRSNNATYASLLEENLGIAATTADGHYSLSMTASPTATTYQLVATATGAQASDTNCKFLALSMSGGNTTLLSGPNSSVGNTGSANNRCWNR